MTDDMAGVARLFSDARKHAALLPTGRLRRDERAFRRVAASPGPGLDQAGRDAWAAARAELAQRGYRLPPADELPRRWWQVRGRS